MYCWFSYRIAKSKQDRHKQQREWILFVSQNVCVISPFLPTEWKGEVWENIQPYCTEHPSHRADPPCCRMVSDTLGSFLNTQVSFWMPKGLFLELWKFYKSLPMTFLTFKLWWIAPTLDCSFWEENFMFLFLSSR